MKPNDQLLQNGFAILSDIYSPTEVEAVGRLIENIHGRKVMFGERHFLQHTPGLLELLMNEHLKNLLAEVAPEYFIIKSIYFDKPAAHPEQGHKANWFVSFHQDKIIFVRHKVEAFGFKNWTQREGEFGVQPPAEYLGNIVTVRIHLDDADETNGALKVIPHSHSEANIRTAAMSSFSDAHAVLCPVKAGGVMLMKPLLVHASSKSISEKPRRVIHLELCGMELPEGMEWAQKSLI